MKKIRQKRENDVLTNAKKTFISKRSALKLRDLILFSITKAILADND